MSNTNGSGDANSVTERRYRIGDPRVQYIEVIARTSDESSGVTIQTDGGGKVWIDWDEVKDLYRVLMTALIEMRLDIADEMQRETMEKLRKMRDGEKP